MKLDRHYLSVYRLKRAAVIIAMIAVISAVFVFFAYMLGFFNPNGERFEVVKEYADVIIYADKETGVQYALSRRGISVMLDADGKPIIYEGEEQ